MLLQYFENSIAGIEAKLAAEPDKPRHRRLFALEASRLGRRLYGGKDPVAWCGILAPFDMLHAMGITSCYIEFVGALLASTGAVGGMLEQAEQLGLSADGCSYHRSVFGAASKDLMPEPSYFIGTSAPCSGGLATIENLAGHYRRPLYVLDVPQRYSEEAVDYLAEQLRGLAGFVEANGGAALDPARLREAVLRSNHISEVLREAYDLAARVPSPISSRDLKNFGIVISLFFGSEAGVQLAEAYRDELRSRVARGESGAPQEKLRLMWLQNRLQFKQPLESWLESELGAVTVCDEFNDVTWQPLDPDDPYPGMARRVLAFPANGAIEQRIEHLKDLASRYKVHGAINPCHWGCRQGAGARGLIVDELREIGVPVLNLEVDCVDSRNFAEGQLRTRLGAFVEMLEAKGSPWGEA